MPGRWKLWIDVVNPSDAFFFSGLHTALSGYDRQVTLRDRAETVSLAHGLEIEGEVLGSHHTQVLIKPIAAITRLLELNSHVTDFDCGLSFENTLNVALCKFRGKKSILFCDNDLKFIKGRHLLLGVENVIRVNADFTFVPSACERTMMRYFPRTRLKTYEGYKEDIYIADYKPDAGFLAKLGTTDYVAIRPEATSSTYVSRRRSLVNELLKHLTRENLPIVYLPRDGREMSLAEGYEVIAPSTPLNGLDISYYSTAVLTGSGTMAREAACMDRTAVSFFPGETLLSVDRQLVDDGRMLHSRDPKEIVDYVLSHRRRRKLTSFERSIRVRDQLADSVVATLEDLLR